MLKIKYNVEKQQIILERSVSNMIAEYSREATRQELIEEIERLQEQIKNSISKSVIQDKIEELKNNKTYLSKFNDWKERDYTNEDIIDNCLEVLQEILKGE